MKSSIRKFGNSQGVLIPKPLLEEIGAKVNDKVELHVESGKIVVAPARRDLRAGWAEDSKRLAEAGEAVLVWPEFGNEADKDLKW
jgi:antitoxin MazE